MEQKNTEKETFKIGFMKKDPKPNAKSYQIKTVQDIMDCVTSENVDQFLTDFEMVVRSCLMMKMINEDGIKAGIIPEGHKIDFPSFEWIDD
jgi:hypothetical protein